jgi:hypothetical protein
MMCVLAVPAAAQTRPAAPAASSSDAPSGVVGAGVSWIHETGTDSFTAKGFTVDVAGNVVKASSAALGIVGDFSFHTDKGFHLTTFAGGARVTATKNAKVKPFGQFLIGRTRFSGNGETAESHNVLLPGGGVDVMMTDRVSFRAQVDWVHVMFSDGSENVARFWFGISCPFGG